MGFASTLQLRPRQTATGADARQQNLRAVLQAVSTDGPISRADLVRRSGLAAPTVSSLIADLVADGLVHEVGPGVSIGGKRPTLLAIKRDGRTIAALDLSREPFEGVLVDLGGAVLDRITRSAGGEVGDAALAAAGGLVADLAARTTAPIAGVGIATPGLVADAATVVEASNLGWHGVPLASLISEAHGLPVWLANDADAAALAEFQALPPAEDSVVAVRIGRGIGVGLVLGGRPYVGTRWAAGEIGHLQVDPDGLRCACGSVGCLETVASAPAIARRLEGDGASADDPRVVEAFADAGRALGAVLASLVAILDVPRIAVTTDLGEAERHLLDAAAAEVRSRLSPAVAQHVTVQASAVGRDVVLRGAAVLALSRALGVVAQ